MNETRFEPKLKCPKCGSEKVTTEHHQMFMVNTGEHYCNSVKTHDPESPATCLDCHWDGERRDLVSSQPSTVTRRKSLCKSPT